MQTPFSTKNHPLSVDINRQIVELGRRHNLHLYIVGGYLRDCVLAEETAQELSCKDIDFAVLGGSAFQFAQTVAEATGGHFVPLDLANDTARVVITEREATFDFAGCVGDTIERDLLRRDYTINALALDTDQPATIIDITGGLADIKSRTIRVVAEQSLVDDPLRLLRGFRFAALLKAGFEQKTLQYIEQHAPTLSDMAVERINFEFFTMLDYDCAKEIELMGKTGILEAIFPDLSEQRQVTANAFHHLGLFDHSIETIPQLEMRLQSLPEWVISRLGTELSASVSRLAATKAACLLHDVGKPQTWEITEEGRHTFIGHDKIGAEMCEVIAERMKWSRPLERFVVKLVKWHLRPGALFHQGPPTEKAIKRFYRNIGEDTPELMLLAFGDFGATRGPGLLGEGRLAQEQNLSNLLDGYEIFAAEKKAMVKLLDGKEVMKLLSIPAGPVVGEMLTALEEAQEFKEVQDRAQAELFVQSLYREKYRK